MFRLSDRAYRILVAEVQQLAQKSSAGEVQKNIVMRRLEKLRSQPGPPASAEELREVVNDIFPEFSDKVLKAAARANRPSKLLPRIMLVTGSLAAIAGTVYVANLPYPMIRIPVAKTLPFLLFPSYMSMDYNYRQAISLVEQADQLVNQATGPADIELGATKVRSAQKSLDALPVWSLGYSPRAYCSLFRCTWRFTLDEFQAARKQVGRMEAKVFQEQNAQTQLSEGETALNSAKQKYQQAKTSTTKSEAIAQWQAAIDQLQEVPQPTLAGRMTQTKLKAYERDFQQIAGVTAGGERTQLLIETAKQLALTAAELAQNPPHSANKWQEIAKLWEDAIAQLEKIQLEDAGFAESSKLLAAYKKNLVLIRLRLEDEQESVEALDEAQNSMQRFFAYAPTTFSAENRNSIIAELQGITNQLKKVKPGTTAYPEAQTLLQSAQKKLQQLQTAK